MNRAILIVALATALATSAHAQLQTLTQSNDNVTVTVGTGIACNWGAPNYENAGTEILRSYNLTGEGVGTDIAIQSIRFGIDEATSTAGMQDVTVNIYRDPTPGHPAPRIDLVLLHTEVFSITDQVGTIFTATLSTPLTVINNPAEDIVVEIAVDDGFASGEAFFVGANTSGETAPSYYGAPLCGQTEPVAISTLGFTSHYIVDIEYLATGLARPGTGDDLQTRIGLNGAIPALFDSVTMNPGDVATMEHDSPLGGMVNAGATFVIGSTTATGNMIPEPFPGIYVDLGTAFFMLQGGVLGNPLLLSPAGLNYSFSYPGGLSGASLHVQCIVSTSLGANGIIAGSNGLEIQLM